MERKDSFYEWIDQENLREKLGLRIEMHWKQLDIFSEGKQSEHREKGDWVSETVCAEPWGEECQNKEIDHWIFIGDVGSWG